ncbi:hypothetical protein HY733_02660 [Candidatus Uhrbacteria bacterium]|nr:hypothetical protein [Candidatus Uhrbacteria bacterium]
MATPEERKARLHAARLARPPSSFDFSRSDDNGVGQANAQARAAERARLKQQDEEIDARLAAKAPELYAPKKQYADPGSFAGKILPGGAPAPLQQFNPPELRQPAQADQTGLDQKQTLQQSRLVSMIERSIAKRMDANTQGSQTASSKSAQRPQERAQSQATDKLREEVKKKAKAAFRRGVIFVLDLLAAAFDLGSTGISFLVDVFIYFFTFGWLNLEMIYGKHFAKGKSRLVGPISWDPIPMPVDKEAIILQGIIVAADIAIAVSVLVVAMGSFCIIHDFTKLTSSVTEAAQIGASIAKGESGGLCLGGIITSAFGL